ncbi:MAG TPA: CocE/NonD family hydrolase [Gemmatimonadaceae bacterium]|nr:CocE/NonD family hydrolase [Gemmatimonadaceae bacterium]
MLDTRLPRVRPATALIALLAAANGSAQTAVPAKSAPYEVTDTTVMVPMADGPRLWGCLVRPKNARRGERFPALLSLDPYSGGCSRTRVDVKDFAEQGYVVAYFHIRGTGHSTGLFPPREYSEEELRDAVALIDWLSKQSWSSGKVGMFGGSWSGFNALQVAMRHPPALKAIVPFVATEDIYNEDVHYADGVFRFDDYNTMADLSLITSLPPEDPVDSTTLANRFDQTPWSLMYLKQQRDGAFWRRDIRLDTHPDTLRVPVLMIGGWYDGYRMAILRAMQRLKTPNKSIVGPWLHCVCGPQPLMDNTRAVLRWWDYWLKGKQTGVMSDPQLVAYMRRPYVPSPHPGTIPGEWRAIPTWPPAGLTDRRLYLNPDRNLDTLAAAAGSDLLRYIPSGGVQVGIWWGDPMPDQRAADAYSLVYDSKPLTSEWQMLGVPVVTLHASATAPHANWYVRLSDVAPDGAVTLITGVGINGTHRESDVTPSPLTPGQTYTLSKALHFTSWIFEPGHRIRIAVSNAVWPMFWPTPYPMTTTLQVGGGMSTGSSITLPLVPPQSAEAAKAAAASVASTNVAKVPATPRDTARQESDWSGPAHVQRDEATGTNRVWYKFQYAGDEGMVLGVEYRVRDDDPSRASVAGTCTLTETIGGHLIEWRSRTEIAGDSTTFHYLHHRQLFRDSVLVRERTWKGDVPRDFQ